MNDRNSAEQQDPTQTAPLSSLDAQEFYKHTETGGIPSRRLSLFVELYRRQRQALGRAASVLDVGCGREAVLYRHMAEGDTYFACDIVPPHREVPNFRAVDLNREHLDRAFLGRIFDVVFCGEVIEHVFSPDRLLNEIRALMNEQSLLILSTPNLAYWVNRFMLLAGISPLFLENSSEVKLGRRTRFLGQGNSTEGHIRVFTHRAMLDLVQRQKWKLVGLSALPVWDFPLDRVVCRFSHHLAPLNVYQLRT